jgi:hypothetical protein
MKILEKIYRQLASDQAKALMDKLESDEEFQKEVFDAGHPTNTYSTTTPRAHHLRLIVNDHGYPLTPQDHRFIQTVYRRLNKEFKIAQTKAKMMHIVLGTLEELTVPTTGAQTSVASPLGALSNLGTGSLNSRLNAIYNQYRNQQNIV